MLASMYGGGALLVRETVRRSGRGWPNIFIPGLAFGIAEEAFMTQSLFNPDYLGLHAHLLRPAHIPTLGIGAWWTIFVLTLHAVWSISVSIAVMESLVPDRAREPWLRKIGLAIVSVLFVLSAIAISRYTVQHDATHFMASRAQFAWTAVLLVACVARHRLPLAGGAALTYAWHAFVQPPSAGAGGTSARIGNVVFAIAAAAVIAVAAKKTTECSRKRAASAGAVLAN